MKQKKDQLSFKETLDRKKKQNKGMGVLSGSDLLIAS